MKNKRLNKNEKYIEKAVKLIEEGVDFIDINTVYIDEEVDVGKGTVIGPCVTISGSSKIGKNCTIYQNTRIKDSTIGDDVTVDSSVILESKVGDKTSVGPFAYMRPNSVVGSSCKVGDFVEVKNSVVGDGTKASHLTYIGDADIGKNVNLGCGVVFVNYDGSNKYRSEIGDGCFIGCNSNLISPVTIEDGAYIAAGATVTENVEKDALCIARAKQVNKRGWAKRKGLFRK